MNSITDPQMGTNDAGSFARSAMQSVPVQARGAIVNRTHRVIRERARAIQEQKKRERSMMVPLILCSVLLILSVLAVWTGLYQYQTVEAVEADVTAMVPVDLNHNHFIVVLLWFVPVLLALLTTLWVRRSRKNTDDEAL